jgi:AcrR family transcriptional regulator
MTQPYESTKELLLVTAGKLFAKLGYDGVSTRMITDRAGLKLSSIHYHFGGKENLYLEAFSYAKSRGVGTNFLDVVNENPSLMSSPEGQAEVIRSTVFRRFHDYFKPERPFWEIQILVREITNPSTALPVLVEKVFKPDIDAAESFYRLIRPEASDYEVSAWIDMFHGQFVFYSMTREPMRLLRGDNALNLNFVKEVSRNLSKALILTLDLPLPKDLQ